MGLFSSITKAIGGAADWLTGAGSEKKANKAARSDIQSGRDASLLALGEGYDEAQGYYDPYAEGGRRGFDEMLAMTLGGDYDVTQTPGFDWRMDQMSKNLNRELGSRGRRNSTFGMNVMSDAYQDLIGREYADQYNRVGSLANTGYNAAGAQSGLAAGRGINLANVQQGNAMSLAQNQAQKGSIGSTSSPLNTATSLMSAGTSLYGGFGGFGGGGTVPSGANSQNAWEQLGRGGPGGYR
jgi:hypothetical protein